MLRVGILGSSSLMPNTLQVLQQLVGHLKNGDPPGRVFLRWLYKAMAKVQLPHHRLWIMSAIQADLLAWKEFLGSYN